ncbi:MAG: tRNA pseudouridine synthase D [Planctomyces sp.]|nr:tRNA pseudouridine synthase D [Planctomyces sp.]
MADSSSPSLSAEHQRQLQTFDFPYLTRDLPGMGGALKEEVSDFVVDEIPVYEPSGSGEHLFLWIEKRDVTGPALTQHVARVLEVDANDIGMAGIKDRRGITRQYVSVPIRCEARLREVDTEQIQVLRQSPHQNKLKTGHLRGNRFSILIRDIHANALELAAPIREQILSVGFPNYFGPQRFGLDGQTVQYGLKTLSLPPRRVRGKRARFELSAVQSWLFNRALAERIEDDLLTTALMGDVMQVRASGGPFVVDDVEREQARLEAGEIGVSGPIFGPKMKMPCEAALERENRVLHDAGLSLDDFSRHRKLCAGTRRAYTIVPEEIKLSAEENRLRFEFDLPSGVYATVLLREFMKVPVSE